MLHKRLNTGLISDYKCIAQDGVAVYEKAISFRDSLYKAPEVGSKYVKYLAKPQYDAQNKTIDWYTPNEAKNGGDDYSIIKWSAATDKEREMALIKIKDLERTLRAYGRRLINRGASGDNLVLAHFLTGSQEGQILPAIHFPNADCVFIVDGEPVITFWGFVDTSDDMLNLPSAKLEGTIKPFVPHNNMAQNIKDNGLNNGLNNVSSFAKAQGQNQGANFTKVDKTIHTNTLQRRNTHRCLFNLSSICPKHKCSLKWPSILGALLGLLLLALLLWLLFKFLPLPSFGNFFNKDASNIPTPSMQVQDKSNNNENLDQDYVSDNNDLTKNDEAIESNDEVIESKDEILVDENTQDIGVIDKDIEIKDTIVDDTSKRAIDIATKKSVDDIQIYDNKHDLNVSNVLNTVKNEPLVLDKKVLSSGNINALNGTWHTKSGLMDKYSGKPLSLQYEQQDNKSALTITRQDGVKCSAITSSSLDANGLLINPNEKAICKDGSSYKMPAISCRLLDNGKTLCEGQYEGQKPFKIRIFK